MSQWPSQRRRSFREPPPKRQQLQLNLPVEAAAPPHAGPPSRLLHLKESCQSHKSTCHPNEKVEDCAQRLEEAPSSCQTALTTLQRIIPQLEEASSSTQDIVHLSQFYENAMEGGFCPHAVHLFLDAGSIKVLMDHLASNGCNKDLERTTAKLLSRLPDSKVLSEIVLPEVVELVYDLTVAASDYPSKNLASPTVKVVLFEKSFRDSRASMNDSSVVEFSSLERISSFLASSLMILDELLNHIRERRLSVTHLTEIFDEMDDHCFMCSQRISNIEFLVGTIRYVLLSDTCQAARPSALRILVNLEHVDSGTFNLLVPRGLEVHLKNPSDEESSLWRELLKRWNGYEDPASWKALHSCIPFLEDGKESLKTEFLLKLLWGSVPFSPSLMDLLVEPSSSDIAVWVVSRSLSGRLHNLNGMCGLALEGGDGDSMPSSKRLKVQDSSTLMSVDDQLLTFLRSAVRIASNWTTTNLDNTPPSEIVTVSSALRLVIALDSPLWKNEEHDSSLTCKYCNSLLLALVALAQRRPKENGPGTLSVQCRVLISCGIGLDALGDLNLVNTAPMLCLAANLFTTCFDLSGLNLDDEMRVAVLAAKMNEPAGCDTSLSEKRAFVLGTLPVLVRYAGVSATVQTGVSALLRPLTADRCLQESRLCIAEKIMNITNGPEAIEERSVWLFSHLSGAEQSSVLQFLQLVVWQSIGWVFLTSSSERLKQLLGLNGISVLNFILDIALLSADPEVRGYASSEVGKIVTSSDWTLLSCIRPADPGMSTPESQYQTGIASFFRCFQEKTTQMEGSLRPAVDTLCSCVHATPKPLRSTVSIATTEFLITQIASIWVRTSGKLKEKAYFTRQVRNLPWCDLTCISNSILHAIFKEMVVTPVQSDDLSKVAPRVWESCFHDFSKVVGLIESHGSSGDTEDIVAEMFPSSVSKFVCERNGTALLLLAGYRSFQRLVKKASTRNRKRTGSSHSSGISVVGQVAFGSHPVIPKLSPRSWVRTAEDSLRDQCLRPDVLEQLVPKLFREASSTDLAFFRETTLDNKLSLQSLVGSRHSRILQNFVVYVGEHPTSRGISIKALERAVMAKVKNVDVASRTTRSIGSCCEEVVKWVSSEFMYLLVNVAQLKWPTKSTLQRTQALRSLDFSLEYLNRDEAPQFLPIIMATVNSALDEKPNDADNTATRENLGELYSQAISVLSRFVRLAAPANVEIIGQNLTSLVVALIPILAGDEVEFEQPRRLASDMLSWLLNGELGRELAPYFGTLPFIPRTEVLEPFRIALKSHGVEVHDLQSGEASSMGSDGMSRIAGDVSIAGDSCGSNDEMLRQRLLRQKINTLCPLFQHENTSVRRVSLQHFASSLRNNRDLFLNLLHNERWATSDFLTVKASEQQKSPNDSGSSSGVLQKVVNTLLLRCVEESDPECRILLAKCFGEVGAVNTSTSGLDELNRDFKTKDDYYRVRPPWLYRPPHLHLICSHLVIALKSSQSSSEQHKVAFAIQQILSQMNDLRQVGPRRTDSSAMGKSGPMNEILMDQLSKAGVRDVVEPFWDSEFQEAEISRPKQPPFFRSSNSYLLWISNWVRYMIHRSYETEQSEWTHLFHACRTAVRAQAGVGLAEFLLPALIAFQVCFGSGRDRDLFLQEVEDVLGKDRGTQRMSSTELRKAISTVFSTLETLQNWVDVDRKNAVRRQRADSKPDSSGKDAERKKWARLDPSKTIQASLSKISFHARARAAASVNLQACALRFFELASRETVAQNLYERAPASTPGRYDPTKSPASGTPPDVYELKSTLIALGDYETMSSLEEFVLGDLSERARDRLREKEALDDWQGALHDYERRMQQYPADPSLKTGSLRCLFELGHFESLLQQATPVSSIEAKSLAVEASWRLGRWDAIDEFFVGSDFQMDTADPEVQYQLSVGRIMTTLNRKDLAGFRKRIWDGRHAVMESLSSTARENYGRAYRDIVRLQILREMEDASTFICSSNPSCFAHRIRDTSLGWHRRLEMMSMDGSSEVMICRVALARLVGDRELEADLFVKLGSIGRKIGSRGTATSSLSNAESLLCFMKGPKASELKGSLRLEIAKLKHTNEESAAALRILGGEELDDFITSNPIGSFKQNNDQDNGETNLMAQVRCALKATRWIVEGGLKGCDEITSRFEHIVEAAPKFAKGHFHYAKYLDSLLQSRILARQGHSGESASTPSDHLLRSQAIQGDIVCQTYLVDAARHYTETLLLDIKLDKYVYQALPRLLSLWFEFTTLKCQSTLQSTEPLPRRTFRLSQRAVEPGQGSEQLAGMQMKLNAFMLNKYKSVPTQAFYTALPQIVSRVDTSAVLSRILKRTLVKFPGQAMWPLAWIRQSQDQERKRIGSEIFHTAVQSLKDKNQKSYNLLRTSTLLLDYLYEVALFQDPSRNSKYEVKPIPTDINLSEFIPPIQSALSISLTSGDSGRTRDNFPRYIPRMRAMDTQVTVMASKARPKKLRFHMVSVEDSLGVVSRRESKSGSKDIGELHFLLKQEVKGDLRKDARVQDLNCVVNRIMASCTATKGGIVKKLRLQTFTVTCLSENTGLVEWIPKTTSLRNCITESVNELVRGTTKPVDGSKIVDLRKPRFRLDIEAIQKKYANGQKGAAKEDFIRLTQEYPPILYWWFIAKFKNPYAWYEARTRFTLSTVAWSAIGHVIGLGDRHTENILVVENSGECVHVDFDCIFDKGLLLPKPELVPFRLTQNIIDAFGPTGANGIYSSSLKVAMGTLRKNRDTILANLEPFLNDPVINWKKSRGQQRRPEKDSLVEAKRQMVVIEKRLKGHYSLRVPKKRKLGITGTPIEPDEEDEDGNRHDIPLSVEGQVHKMITEATNPENLLQLYFGWLAWA